MTLAEKATLVTMLGLGLVSNSIAAEIKSQPRAGTVVTTGEADEVNQLIVRLVVSVFVIVGVVFLLRELALGFLTVLAPPEEEHYDPYATYDTYSHYNRQDYYGAQGFRSLGENVSFISRIMKSIDPVESTFAMLNIEEVACRKRTICEVQKAAARYPILSALLKYMSPSVNGFADYKEAQDAGAALEDCSLLYAECPYSMLK